MKQFILFFGVAFILNACKNKDEPDVYIGRDGYYYSDSDGTKKLPQELNACDRAALFGSIYPDSHCKVDTIAKVITLDIPKRVFKDTLLHKRAESIMTFAKLFIGGTDSAYYVDKCFGVPGDTLTYDMPASFADSLELFAHILPEDVLYCLGNGDPGDIKLLVIGDFEKFIVGELSDHSCKYARLFHCLLRKHGIIDFSWYCKYRPNALTIEYSPNDYLFKNIRYTL